MLKTPGGGEKISTYQGLLHTSWALAPCLFGLLLLSDDELGMERSSCCLLASSHQTPEIEVSSTKDGRKPGGQWTGLCDRLVTS